VQGLEESARNAVRLAPRDHEALTQFGQACMNAFRIDEAADCFSAAVEVAPGDLAPLIGLELLSIRSLRDRRSLDRSPKIAGARSQAIDRLRASHRHGQLDDTGLKNLLILLSGEQDTFPEAVEAARKIASRDDIGGDLAHPLSVIFLLIGDLPNLLRFTKIVFESDPSRPSSRLALAYVRLLTGYDHWHEAWKSLCDLERYSNPLSFIGAVPTWTGQPLGNKKILVYQEQGFGDAILALRLVPLLAKRGVRFDLWVSPALAGLAGGVKGYENLIRSEARPDPRVFDCDYACSLLGLIPALGVEPHELKNTPTVLSAAPDRASTIRKRLRALKGRRVGLSYGGNPDRRDDWFRAVPPSALKPLAKPEGISWVNLSIDDRPNKAEAIQLLNMDDPMPEAKDFEDTAAIISELDAVIAIDSSVAHLAAGLGKPVWVLVPPMLDWRWQIGSDTRPWWPNATLLRSAALGEWDAVIEDLAARLVAAPTGSA